MLLRSQLPFYDPEVTFSFESIMAKGTQAPPSLWWKEEYVTYLVLLLRWPQLPLWGQSHR